MLPAPSLAPPVLNISTEQRLALLPPAERAAILDGLDLALLRYSWDWTARPYDQLAATNSKARLILMLAGRGAGKSRTGSEWVRRKVSDKPREQKLRFALVGRTAADVRDVMVQGDSGLLSVFPPSEAPNYIPTARRVDFAEGSMALCFTAEEADQLRGPQFHYTWADELAAWNLKPNDSGLNAWDQAQLATRLGSDPQIFATTTPKRLKLIRELQKRGVDPNDPTVEIFVASTFENVHLSQTYFDVITGLYAGTRLGAQELFAEILDDVAGALWTETLLEDLRTYTAPSPLPPRRVVAVDPSVADEPGDECGIIVVGSTAETRPTDRHGWVLADRSLLASPAVWAHAVVEAAVEYDAIVVAEANQGGAMVREMITNINPALKVRLVHAKVSKKLRAEPVTGVYEQRRVQHVGRFPELEDQMTTWVPSETVKSPDRVDALVHGVTALMLPSARGVVGGEAQVSTPSRRPRAQILVGARRL